MNETVRVTAEWTFILSDAKTGEIKQVVKRKNVITDAGFNYFAQAYANIFGQNGNRYNWCMMLGTGTGTPSGTDTQLFQGDPTTAKKGIITVTDNTVEFKVRYQANEANEQTWTEAGIYDGIAKWVDFDPTVDYTLGNLISHVLIYPAITKDSNNALDVYVRITFKRG